MFSCVHIFNIKKKKINNSITILHDVNNWISPLVRAQASSTYFGNLFRNTKKKKKTYYTLKNVRTDYVNQSKSY